MAYSLTGESLFIIMGARTQKGRSNQVQSESKPGVPLQTALSTTQKIKILVIAVLAVLVLVVVVQNTGPVEAHLLLATFTLPLAVLLFGAFVIGFVIGMLFRTRLFRSK